MIEESNHSFNEGRNVSPFPSYSDNYTSKQIKPGNKKKKGQIKSKSISSSRLAKDPYSSAGSKNKFIKSSYTSIHKGGKNMDYHQMLQSMINERKAKNKILV